MNNKPVRTKREKLHHYRLEKFYDICFVIVFIALLVLVSRTYPFFDDMIASLSTLEIIILFLAVFRLTILVTTDNVFGWCRDLFMNVKVNEIDPEVDIERSIPTKGFRRQVAILLDCPWCISMWLALGSLYAWFTWPGIHIFFYILALSGVAAIIHMLIKKL